MVIHTRDYRWSSYRANAEGEVDGLTEPHAAYQGPSDYRGLIESGLEDSLVTDIRKATRAGYLAGTMRKRRGRQMRKMGSVPI
jgi:putative transposase